MTESISSEEIHLMLVDCQKRERKLSEWELSFIHSLLGQYSRHRLSQRQIEKLEVIWDRVTTKE